MKAMDRAGAVLIVGGLCMESKTAQKTEQISATHCVLNVTRESLAKTGGACRCEGSGGVYKWRVLRFKKDDKNYRERIY